MDGLVIGGLTKLVVLPFARLMTAASSQAMRQHQLWRDAWRQMRSGQSD